MNKGTILGIIAALLLVGGGWYAFSSGVFGGGSNAPSGDTIVTTSPSAEYEDLLAADQSGTVAVVNDSTLPRSLLVQTLSDLAAVRGFDLAALSSDDFVALQSEAIDIMISQTLLDEAVAVSAVTVTPEEVDERIAATMAQFPDEAAFEEALAAQNLSLEDFRAQVQKGMITDKYLADELAIDTIEVTDEEIQTTYDAIAANTPDAPPLEDVRLQVEQMVRQDKQQAALYAFIDTLRADSEIEIVEE